LISSKVICFAASPLPVMRHQIAGLSRPSDNVLDPLISPPTRFRRKKLLCMFMHVVFDLPTDSSETDHLIRFVHLQAIACTRRHTRISLIRPYAGACPNSKMACILIPWKPLAPILVAPHPCSRCANGCPHKTTSLRRRASRHSAPVCQNPMHTNACLHL